VNPNNHAKSPARAAARKTTCEDRSARALRGFWGPRNTPPLCGRSRHRQRPLLAEEVPERAGAAHAVRPDPIEGEELPEIPFD